MSPCIETPLISLRLGTSGASLLSYTVKPSGRSHDLAPPTIEIDGSPHVLSPGSWKLRAKPRTLANGVIEHVFDGSCEDGLIIALTVRVADDSPVVRFRYTLACDRPRRLTKTQGQDAVTHTGLSLASLSDAVELRLSEFVDMVHGYVPNEVQIAQKEFDASVNVMGPLLLAGDGDRHQVLLAYEHGSTYPDAYLNFALSPDRTVALRGVKGNYLAGQEVNRESPFESIWFEFAAVDGTRDDLAGHYRHFVLNRFAKSDATRRPHIFYNTWNYQERLFNWHKRPYLSEMNQERMLSEIEAAARMGIEVFVIDTGWYARTGDWQVDLRRFPDGLKSIKAKLDEHGMRLGLWFDNAAAISSQAFLAFQNCVMSKDGKIGEPHPIWETEASHRMCIVSRYCDAWADQMIRLHHETGVTYFKWDAIGQYGCDSCDHDHGTVEHSPRERAERFSFLLPIYMARAATRIAAAVPGAICDFDMTESHRCVGLAFLEAGKFFLINNGPYSWDYNIPTSRMADGNVNLFFHPGPARTWFMRYPLSYDRWIPSSLLLTHYLPDDADANQENAVASLALGQHGIWGDLPAVSLEGQQRIGHMLDQYKRVREDATAASPVRQGVVGGDGEVHEKLNPANGRGVVCMFAGHPGRYTYVTQHCPIFPAWHHDGVEVTRLADGRAKIEAVFGEKDKGKLIVFGA